MSEEKDWEPCPRCGSNQVKKSSKFMFFIGCIIAIPFCIFLSAINETLVYGGISLCVIGALYSPFKTRNFTCKECNHTWPASKENQEGEIKAP